MKDRKDGVAKGVRLAARAHRLYRLAPDLLLVFKPRGHCEEEHEHPRSQRLRVLRGELEVRIGRTRSVLRPGPATLTVPARRRHRTAAGQDTWLVVEWLDDRALRQRGQPATKSR